MVWQESVEAWRRSKPGNADHVIGIGADDFDLFCKMKFATMKITSSTPESSPVIDLTQPSPLIPSSSTDTPQETAARRQERCPTWLRSIKSFLEMRKSNVQPEPKPDDLDEVINPDTGLTRRQALEARKKVEELVDVSAKEDYEKFMQLPAPERELRESLIRDEKVEERLDQAIENNKKLLTSVTKKISGVLTPSKRNEIKQQSRFSREQWREKLLQEQGEPGVTREDIQDLMSRPRLQEELLDYAVRSRKANPDKLVRVKSDERESRLAGVRKSFDDGLAASRARGAPDPYALPDDDSIREIPGSVQVEYTSVEAKGEGRRATPLKVVNLPVLL